MAKPRKPIPKSQLSLSNSKQSAFEGIEDRGEVGNPNNAISPPNPNYTETGIDFNRSNNMSLKGDSSKQYAIGLKDIDEAIFYYFQNKIKPFVYQNGIKRDVPVIYGAPERWKSFQRDGYYRDKKGAIMLPIIVIKRDSLSKDRTVANKLDANQPNLYGKWSKQYSPKNFYSNFGTLNNRKPIEKFHIVAQPDYVTLEYSCLIQTYYMEQLNKVIEACEYASDAYWGMPERFQFRAFIDSFTTATELTQGKDRLVTGTFNIRLRGYILPDTIQKELNATKIYNSKAKITINTEAVSDINGIEIISNPTEDGRKRT
jgi:hypothetical protein|tara:strand:- start:1837 stop:2781 length:945 start_codon:yes stop_codon:yes gene_type:complete